MEGPHFLARKIRNFQREQAAGSFQCTLCTDVTRFPNGTRLKEHVSTTHSDVKLEGPEWQSFVDQAKTRLRTVRTAAPKDPAVLVEKPLSDDGSMRPHLDSQSASDPVRSHNEHTHSFEELSLTRDAESRAAKVPQKRPGEASPQRLPNEPATQASPRNRRFKTASGGSVSARKEQHVDRRTPVSRRLFDPTSDSPLANVNTRKTAETGKPLLSRADGRHQQSMHKDRAPMDDTNRRQQGDRGAPRTMRTQPLPTASANMPARKDEYEEHDDEDDYDVEPELLLQPETRPISHEQLVVEVKGIYAGLVMVEAKCIDVDEKQTAAAQELDPSKRTSLTGEQWSALIALHKTLLHEHHDFFLASQHPAASPALSKLASKYSMPARMWRHGIHAFLEVLRFRLPESLDHMLAFIYIAYSMMALLYETVEAFKDTWIECLGDLGRYRMAIEDDDVRDREVWSGVAKHWYSMAEFRNPQLGRLPHHLAILSRPYTIQQLSLYLKSLTCSVPFESARTSIMSVFNPVLEGKSTVYQRSNTTEILFIHVHAIRFTGGSRQEYKDQADRLLIGDQFSKFISRAGPKFKEIGVSAALANIAALQQYGATNGRGVFCSMLRLRFEEARPPEEKFTVTSGTSEETSQEALQRATNLTSQEQLSSFDAIETDAYFTFGLLSVALVRSGSTDEPDPNVFPMIHVYLVFIWYLASVEPAMALVERFIPWGDLVAYLNKLAEPKMMTARVYSTKFPGSTDGGKGRPLPEDYALRGQPYTREYFPVNWHKDAGIDDEERLIELPSFRKPRTERILWAGHKIACFNRWILYNDKTCGFSETSYVKELPPWDANKMLEPTSLVDVGISDATKVSQPQQQSRLALSTPPSLSPSASVTRDSVEPACSSPAPTPKYILKRASRPPEDVKMEDASSTKQENIASMTEKIHPATEEWLNTLERKTPLKKERIAYDGITEKVRVYDVSDETKELSKI